MCLVHGVMLQLVQLANRAEQMILIIDLKGVKAKLLSNKTIFSALKKIMSLCLQYFPEMLYKGFIVNVPLSFAKLWSTLEAQLPAGTRAKIRAIGGCTHPDIAALVTCRLTLAARVHAAGHNGRHVERQGRDGREVRGRRICRRRGREEVCD
eukprot:TRINITY_DN16799_c0_g1_i3.p2 TRINITY_DN16799_c0_g1~~TRINITY_DN16799_c0_g1_i3.p2  ORF type:complete len:152 (-),score=12.36 TRINITY_DN16799_c0_g1_i3:93-548(-)